MTKRKSKKSDKNDAIKKAIIKGIESGAFISVICSKAGINRATFYRWINEDKEFGEAVKLARLSQIGMVEDALYQQCLKGNTTAIIFFLCNRDKANWQNVNKIEQNILPNNAGVVNNSVNLIAVLMEKDSDGKTIKDKIIEKLREQAGNTIDRQE